MKKQILALGLVFLISIMVALIVSAQRSNQIDELYVFGDSLSDVGNVFQATGRTYPPSPPYFEGHYSNGQVWVEHLASKLALPASKTTNLAYGGATTGGNSTLGVPSLLEQVQRFTQAHRQANPNALYVVWAGANDYLQGATNPTGTIAHLSQVIASLSAIGAKSILVGNLPDLGKLPATRSNASSSTLSSLTELHNLNLAKLLDQLNQKSGSDVRVIELDANSLYQEAIAHSTKFGFTNVTSACLANQSLCSSPDQFLFWDGIHPTKAAHRLLGEAAFAVLQNDQSLTRGYQSS